MVNSIATECGLEPTNDALLALLKYYTLKGILLYYPDVETLSNTIFISPQRVSDLVTCVIKIHDYKDPRSTGDLLEKYERFNKFALLEEELLDDMLQKRNMQKLNAGRIRNYNKDIVLGLLEKFDLAIEVDRRTKFVDEEDCYPMEKCSSYHPCLFIIKLKLTSCLKVIIATQSCTIFLINFYPILFSIMC